MTKRDIEENPAFDGYTMFYKHKGQLMKPWTEDTVMYDVGVPEGVTPGIGGMIAISLEDPSDKWYVSKEFFAENYRR